MSGDPLASYDRVDGISRWGVSALGAQRARARMPPHFRHRTRQRKRQRVRTIEASRARLDGDLARYVDGAGTQNRAAAAQNPLYGLIEQSREP